MSYDWVVTWRASSVFPVCQNLVVAVGAEGWFHLFDLTAATASKSDSSSQHEFLSSEEQKPFFTQHIPANTKVILISDIGECLRCTLIVFVHAVYSAVKSDSSVCVCVNYCRWWWTLWAGGGLHGPGGASFPLGGALWWFRPGIWAAGSAEEMAPGGTGMHDTHW